jgi:hypothetical protein
MQLLSQDHELPEPSVPAAFSRNQAETGWQTPFVGTGPAQEGNILCDTRGFDSIRWIVYEVRDSKVERGARKDALFPLG